MFSFTNEDTVAVHVTKRCNLRCGHCYQQTTNYSDVINFPEVFKAIDKLNPKNLVLYGGECMLYPDSIKQIMQRYPDKGYILHTNGTIDNSDIFDAVDVIFFTVETFFWGRQTPYRILSKEQFKKMLGLLEKYRHKAMITHNVYPLGNDGMFYNVVEFLGVPHSTYPIVMDTGDFIFNSAVAEYLNTSMPILNNPKLRILENGTITRDMRGIYNICKADEWKEEYRDILLPVADRCKSCEFFETCPSVKIFPHFCKDVLEKGKSKDPHFCQLARSIYKLQNEESDIF